MMIMSTLDWVCDRALDVDSFLLGLAIFDKVFRMDLSAPTIEGRMVAAFEFAVIILFVQWVVKKYIQSHVHYKRKLWQLVALLILGVGLSFLTVLEFHA
ncbi:MAG: hypothetical protein V1777_04475 [Candidatus Micrarchaeota archaeon]